MPMAMVISPRGVAASAAILLGVLREGAARRLGAVAVLAVSQGGAGGLAATDPPVLPPIPDNGGAGLAARCRARRPTKLESGEHLDCAPRSGELRGVGWTCCSTTTRRHQDPPRVTRHSGNSARCSAQRGFGITLNARYKARPDPTSGGRCAVVPGASKEERVGDGGNEEEGGSRRIMGKTAGSTQAASPARNSDITRCIPPVPETDTTSVLSVLQGQVSHNSVRLHALRVTAMLSADTAGRCPVALVSRRAGIGVSRLLVVAPRVAAWLSQGAAAALGAEVRAPSTASTAVHGRAARGGKVTWRAKSEVTAALRASRGQDDGRLHVVVAHPPPLSPGPPPAAPIAQRASDSDRVGARQPRPQGRLGGPC